MKNVSIKIPQSLLNELLFIVFSSFTEHLSDEEAIQALQHIHEKHNVNKSIDFKKIISEYKED